MPSIALPAHSSWAANQRGSITALVPQLVSARYRSFMHFGMRCRCVFGHLAGLGGVTLCLAQIQSLVYAQCFHCRGSDNPAEAA